jgi:hypothetical protein
MGGPAGQQDQRAGSRAGGLERSSNVGAGGGVAGWGAREGNETFLRVENIDTLGLCR